MRTEFRQRAFLPLMIPLAVLGTLALTVGLFALILLYLPTTIGNVVAIVLAAGILIAIALATSQESLDPVKKLGVAVAAGVPLVFGGVTALAGVCGAEGALCPANFVPELGIPPGAPVIVSTQPAAFDNETVTLPAMPYLEELPENLSIAFDNQSNIPHNLYVTGGDSREAEVLESAEGEPAFTETYSSGQESVLFVPPAPGEYLYYCSIHDGMNGTLIIEEGAEPQIDGEAVAVE